MIIICSALIADAIIGNYQEKIMKEHHVPNVEIVFYSFTFGFGIVLTGLLATNNFFSSIQFWNQVRMINFADEYFRICSFFSTSIHSQRMVTVYCFLYLAT